MSKPRLLADRPKNHEAIALYKRLSELVHAVGYPQSSPENAWKRVLPEGKNWRRKKKTGADPHKATAENIDQHVGRIFLVKLCTNGHKLDESTKRPFQTVPAHLAWTSPEYRKWLTSHDNEADAMRAAIAWSGYVLSRAGQPECPWKASDTDRLGTVDSQGPSACKLIPEVNARYSTAYANVVHFIQQQYMFNNKELEDFSRQSVESIQALLRTRETSAHVRGQVVPLDTARLLFKQVYDRQWELRKKLGEDGDMRTRALASVLGAPFDAICDLVTFEISNTKRDSIEDTKRAVASVLGGQPDPDDSSRFILAPDRRPLFRQGAPFELSHVRCVVNEPMKVPAARTHLGSLAEARRFVERYIDDATYSTKLLRSPVSRDALLEYARCAFSAACIDHSKGRHEIPDLASTKVESIYASSFWLEHVIYSLDVAGVTTVGQVGLPPISWTV